MNDFVKYIIFYTSPIIKALRLFVFLGLLAWGVYTFTLGEFPKFPLFFLSLFVMQEIFFFGKINVVRPKSTLGVSSQALLPFELLLQYPQVAFMLQKAGIAKKEIQEVSIEKEALLQKAAEVAKHVGGMLITTMDIFAAYLLLTEAQTKLLFSKELKEEDVLALLVWARLIFPYEEVPKKHRVSFHEEGIGDAITTGWTPETQKYTTYFTQKVTREKPFVIDRVTEYKEIVEGLVSRENSNVLLVGERGSGKEMLVRLVAYACYEGSMPSGLNHKKVYELMLGALFAGATPGDLEARLQAVVAEISHSGNVMLYIPEFQEMLGASSFGVDLSGPLLPYLKDGELPIIATMTPGGYKSFVEGKPIEEALHVIHLKETEEDTVLQMLFASAQYIERKHGVHLGYTAVKEALVTAQRYQQDLVLPGSAVVLLSDAANAVSLSGQKLVTAAHVIELVEKKTNVNIAVPKGEEKELLLHLEDKLHERVIDQVEGIHAISEALRRMRTGISSQTKPISFLFLGPTGVGKTETAKALADLYYHGEVNMIRLDMSEYADEEGIKRLLGAAPGQGDERGELTEKIHDHPNSLVLLDEFEKASPKILDLFLQVLDDGRLTDSKGKTVSFIDAMIIATSNAGSEFIREEVGKGTPIDKTFHSRLLDVLQKEHIFKPELLNRFDDVITFKPLGQSELAQIIKLLLVSVAKRLSEKDIALSFDQKILDKIAKEGADEQFGARPLRRFIQDNIEDILAQKMLKGEIERGKKVLFTTDDAGEIQTLIS